MSAFSILKEYCIERGEKCTDCIFKNHEDNTCKLREEEPWKWEMPIVIRRTIDEV